MQPLLLSVRESEELGAAVWRRTGKDILYFKNHYARADKDDHQDLEDQDREEEEEEEDPEKRRRRLRLRHQTASFTVSFPYSSDVCYLAYHYPYTYTRLMVREARENLW